MNEFVLSEVVEKLESIFLNVIYMKPEDRIASPNITHLSEIKTILNEVFDEKNLCQDVIFTNNTDKQFFGVRINPLMSAQDALTILTSDEKFKLGKYQVEIDSKLLDINLSASEIVAIILFEISSMIDSYEVIDQVRALIDLHVLSEDDVISIRDSVNYSQLIIYALKDTLYKVSSVMFKEDLEELTSNRLIQALELEDALVSGQQKIMSSSYGTGETVRSPKVIILKWVFMIYKDIKHNSTAAKDTLKDAMDFTASRLEKFEIEKTILAISRIGQTIMEGTRIDKVLEQKGMYTLSEISLFSSLKKNGLRAVEDAYYEYAMRIKNCSTEEDAMYILRGISTRLNILEDYLNNTPDLSDFERKKWTELAYRYRALREELAKKKIWNKNNYGIFINYDELDKLDEE